jgi:hypothetical protein
MEARRRHTRDSFVTDKKRKTVVASLANRGLQMASLDEFKAQP